MTTSERTSHHATGRFGIAEMSTGVSDADFMEALTTARDEGNLSRANVVPGDQERIPISCHRFREASTIACPIMKIATAIHRNPMMPPMLGMKPRERMPITIRSRPMMILVPVLMAGR